MKTWLCACVGLLLTTSLVQADIGPRPGPRPVAPPADKSVPFTIETVDGNGPTRLIIPKKFAGMRAALDVPGDAVAAAPSRLPTVLAGFFLTMSLVCGGLWVVRSRNVLGTHTVVGILVGVAFLAVGSAVLFANAAPFQPVAPLAADNGVVVEMVDNGDAVKMIVPKARLAKFANANGGAGGGIAPIPVNPGNPIPIRPIVRPLPAPAPGGAGGIGIPAPAPVPLPNPIPKPLEEK